MAHLEEMPLFPLHAVLFPYASLQLHVFEERYQEMVRTCMEYEQPFGIVLIRSGSEVGDTAEPYMVGTAVSVRHVHTYEDGRMDVQVRGERRFRVRKLDDSRPYLVGFVEPVVELEIEDEAKSIDLSKRTGESLRMLIEGTIARPEYNVEITLPDTPTALSFVVANFLPLENLEKQRLLETTDTIERLNSLIPLIERQIVEARTDSFHSQPYRITEDDRQEWIHQN